MARSEQFRTTAIAGIAAIALLSQGTSDGNGDGNGNGGGNGDGGNGDNGGGGNGDNGGGGTTNEAPNVFVDGFDASDGAENEISATAGGTDPDGTIQDWDWTLRRNGSLVDQAAGQTVMLEGTTTGTYTIEVTGTDDGGATDSDSMSFEWTIDTDTGGGGNGGGGGDDGGSGPDCSSHSDCPGSHFCYQGECVSGL